MTRHVNNMGMRPPALLQTFGDKRTPKYPQNPHPPMHACTLCSSRANQRCSFVDHSTISEGSCCLLHSSFGSRDALPRKERDADITSRPPMSPPPIRKRVPSKGDTLRCLALFFPALSVERQRQLYIRGPLFRLALSPPSCHLFRRRSK